MSNPIIKVNQLSKRYRIGAKVDANGLDNFRDVILNTIRTPIRNLQRLRKLTNFDDTKPSALSPTPDPDIIWALKDVSFEVNKREVVGIIGRNGSGKSTLLKILSRITEPTEGYVELRGRVSSLLEVGTGFHRELTGRENIYLNGSILGMKKWEIDKRFDEIVAFSEIEKFIDTPVKHYSSGMYVRLAFAVAAHLEPEILLVDEVLAVGDVAFQKKCLGKMGDIAKEGRTVMFVSHNMGAVETLCNKSILLDNGHIVMAGETKKIVSYYLAKNYQRNGNPLYDCPRRGNGKLQVVSFHLESQNGEILEVAKSGDPVILAFGFKNRDCASKDRISFSFSIHTDHELGLSHYYSHFSNVYFENIPSKGFFKCSIPEIFLAPGNYFVHCRAVMNGDQTSGEEIDWPQVFIPMIVVGGDFYGTGNVNLSTWGPILIKGKWLLVNGEDR